MRPRTAAAAVLVLGLLSPATAQHVVDQFGQTVPPELAAKVDQARQLRLPYTPSYNPEAAVALLQTVVEEKSDFYRAWFNLGLALGEIERIEDANAAFDRAIDILEAGEIADITIFNSAGWVNLTAGNYDRAEALFLRGLERQNAGSEHTVRAMYNNLGLLYFYTQRLTEAESMLSVAKDMGSSSAADTLRMIQSARARAIQIQRRPDD